jgi:hypothetical protein
VNAPTPAATASCQPIGAEIETAQAAMGVAVERTRPTYVKQVAPWTTGAG